MSLLTKTQLKDYEPGEFSDIQQRTCKDTLNLIEHFPWSQQKDHLVISPTNPSVTIEGPSGDYLKLALYYNDKFVLYYLDTKNHLYTKSFTTLSDAYPIIQSFFDDKFTTGDFKHQLTTFLDNKIHFKTKDFNYTIHYLPTLLMVCFISAFLLVPSITILTTLIIRPYPTSGTSIFFSALYLMLTAGFTIFFIAAFISHYRASNGRVLSISRGNPLFKYGPIDAPTTYDKKDIQNIILYGGNNSKGSDGLKKTEIIFTDGTDIYISGLLLSIDKLAAKFPQQNIDRSRSISPFIPSA